MGGIRAQAALDETIGSDRLISLTRTDEGRRYFSLDGLRSVVNLTDDLGSPVASYHLDTWGNFRFPTELTASANRFAFTGHIFDTETGLYNAKARYFDPKLGRFLTQDSFLGTQDNPPSLHRYLYGYANPLRYVDPTGHDAFQIDMEMSGVVDPRTKEEVRRAEVRGAAGLAATVSWFAKAAWGTVQQSLGRGWEGFGEAVVEAGRHPLESAEQAAASLKRHVNEQMDIAQERLARGQDWEAAWGFTEEVTAPISTTTLTVGEGLGAMGKAALKPIGPSLDRMRVALLEAAEAQQQAAELTQARALVGGRRGELGAVGRIMSDGEARGIVAAAEGSAPVQPLNKILYGMEDAPSPPMKGSRQAAIDRAWTQEVELIQESGRGTRPWTEAETQKILAGSSYGDLGYTGHHINRVVDAPAWKGDPRNIEFLKQGAGGEHMRRGHPGGTRAVQPSNYLIDREAMLRSLGGGVVDASR